MNLNWEGMGLNDGGLPAHLPMGVTAEGDGPVEPDPPHHVVCWCPDPECPLTRSLNEAWKAGRREGVRRADELFGKEFADPDWEGQCSIGFAATVSQVFYEEVANG